mmetsp:Transcript_26930/g.88062  ORF Transcript_26930/g.88062 Transcript_26930/m.88062 type:complete len:85 (-) Transcript_26930:102-356(-)
MLSCPQTPQRSQCVTSIEHPPSLGFPLNQVRVLDSNLLRFFAGLKCFLVADDELTILADSESHSSHRAMAMRDMLVCFLVAGSW